MITQTVNFRELVKEIPSTTYGTFGLYKYPAKFIPQIIAHALKTYSKEGESIFDPFAGYGTVGTVAKIYGNDYELWDLNPLLKHLHTVASLKSANINSDGLINKLIKHKTPFSPDWPNIDYWFPEKFLPLLQKAWGFYHSLNGNIEKPLLLIPLIKATRYFSYNEEKRQKLSRSNIAIKKTKSLLSQDWQNIFYKMVHEGICNISRKIQEYSILKPQPVKGYIKAGKDIFHLKLKNEHDILITSPPYLQAQEYIRAAKMDLFWLGYSKDTIRELSKKEIPYCNISPCPIYSDTFEKYHKQITEPHLQKLFENYFFGVLGSLSYLQEKIKKYLLFFVGSATVRTKAIPLDKIFKEHFTELGWQHEITLIDTIAARSMFFYKKNPATNSHDKRMTTEQLVVLKRK